MILGEKENVKSDTANQSINLFAGAAIELRTNVTPVLRAVYDDLQSENSRDEMSNRDQP